MFPGRKTSIDSKDKFCKDCHKIWNKNYRINNKEKAKESTKKWISRNRERINKTSKEWASRNTEKVYNSYRKIYERDRKKVLDNVRKYVKENPGKVNAASRLRRERQRNSVPKWLTQEQRKEIELIYINCPEGMQVDHIIPIAGKEVCGLHVPWNLQYLTKEENCKKGNKLID